LAAAAQEAVVQEAGGMLLHLSESNTTGYKGVHCVRRAKSKPFVAKAYRDGRTFWLGHFATAREAAVAFARFKAGVNEPADAVEWGQEGAAEQMEEEEEEEAAGVEEVEMEEEEEEEEEEEADAPVAEVDGVRLHMSASCSTGYKGVSRYYGLKNKPFVARVARAGRRTIYLGCFGSAQAAAVAYAHSVAGTSALVDADALDEVGTSEEVVHKVDEAEQRGQTGEDVVAEVEGVQLHLSEQSITGYKGVTYEGERSRPFKAVAWCAGRGIALGYFETALAAAIAYAHFMAGTGTAKEVGALEDAQEARDNEKEEEAEERAAAAAEAAVAEAEGVQLHLSSSSSTGYKCVRRMSKGTNSRPFMARGRRDGRVISLGCFATAREAAVAYARHVALVGAQTAEEVAQAAVQAEALDEVEEPEAVVAEEAEVEGEEVMDVEEQDEVEEEREDEEQQEGHVEDDQWEVERLLDRRYGPCSHGRGHSWHYLVRWSGWSEHFDSWEASYRIDPSLMVEYDAEHPRMPIFARGARVSARWRRGFRWYAGRVAAVHEDDRYDVAFDDGDYEHGVLLAHMKPEEAS
jgi:hypothetical protein